MPELRSLLDEILPLETWKEVEARFVAFRRRHKFVPKKNVMYHLYKAQEVCSSVRLATSDGSRDPLPLIATNKSPVTKINTLCMARLRHCHFNIETSERLVLKKERGQAFAENSCFFKERVPSLLVRRFFIAWDGEVG